MRIAFHAARGKASLPRGTRFSPNFVGWEADHQKLREAIDSQFQWSVLRPKNIGFWDAPRTDQSLAFASGVGVLPVPAAIDINDLLDQGPIGICD
jgi:hypothetical protein